MSCGERTTSKAAETAEEGCALAAAGVDTERPQRDWMMATTQSKRVASLCVCVCVCERGLAGAEESRGDKYSFDRTLSSVSRSGKLKPISRMKVVSPSVPVSACSRFSNWSAKPWLSLPLPASTQFVNQQIIILPLIKTNNNNNYKK